MNVIDNSWATGSYCGPGVRRVIGDQPVHHFGRHGRARIVESGVLVSDGRRRAIRSCSAGRWTVIVPCITSVAGHQVTTAATTATTTVIIVAVVVVAVWRQAEDLTLDEPFTRHGPDGRRGAHDG